MKKAIKHDYLLEKIYLQLHIKLQLPDSHKYCLMRFAYY